MYKKNVSKWLTKLDFWKKKLAARLFFSIGLNHVQNKVFHHLLEKVTFKPLMNFKRKNIMEVGNITKAATF